MQTRIWFYDESDPAAKASAKKVALETKDRVSVLAPSADVPAPGGFYSDDRDYEVHVPMDLLVATLSEEERLELMRRLGRPKENADQRKFNIENGDVVHGLQVPKKRPTCKECGKYASISLDYDSSDHVWQNLSCRCGWKETSLFERVEVTDEPVKVGDVVRAESRFYNGVEIVKGKEIGVVVGIAGGKFAVRSFVHEFMHPDGPCPAPGFEEAYEEECFTLFDAAQLRPAPEYQHKANDLRYCYSKPVERRTAQTPNVDEPTTVNFREFL